MWPEIIAQLEAGSLHVLVSGNVAFNWDHFSGHYKLIEAAGGLVQNEADEWLFIHRNGMWDLPKGKLEKGETIEKCAVREVAEECGIEEPSITEALSPTFHTYSLGAERILKKTHWYLMKSQSNAALIPQTEEGITEVKWVDPTKAKALAEASFGSIRQVVKEGFRL